jgi:hypothetical protein
MLDFKRIFRTSTRDQTQLIHLKLNWLPLSRELPNMSLSIHLHTHNHADTDTEKEEEREEE